MSLIEYTQAPAEFKEFSKIGRLSREIIVTEKIDGTNAHRIRMKKKAAHCAASSSTPGRIICCRQGPCLPRP